MSLLKRLLPGQSPGARISGRLLKPVKPATVCRNRADHYHGPAGGRGRCMVQAEGEPGVTRRATEGNDR